MNSIRPEMIDPLGAQEVYQPSPKDSLSKSIIRSDSGYFSIPPTPLPISPSVSDDTVSPTPETQAHIHPLFLPPDDQGPNPFAPPPTKIKKTTSMSKVHTIGLSNLISLPQAFMENVKSLLNAIHIHDNEGIIEHSIKLVTLPLGLTNGVENWLALLICRSIVLSILTISSLTLGSIFISMELILEINRLVRVVLFRDSLSIQATLKNLQKSPRALKISLLKGSLSKLQKTYFELSDQDLKRCDSYAKSKINDLTLSEGLKVDLYLAAFNSMKDRKLKGKLESLKRRINPKSVAAVQKDLATFLNAKEANFSSQHEYTMFIKHGLSLFQRIDEESRKIFIIHAIGIIGICFGILSFAFGAVTAPLALLAGLFAFQVLFLLARGNADRAFLDRKGYTWCIKNTLIPAFILEFFNKPKAVEAIEMKEILNPDIELHPSKTSSLVGAFHEKPRSPLWIDNIPLLRRLH